MGDDAAARRDALLREKFTGRNEVAETIHLLFALAVLVPAIALVLAAAHMGNGVHEAAIDEAERVGGEASWDAHAVSAVAVEQKRHRAVELGLLAIEERDR